MEEMAGALIASINVVKCWDAVEVKHMFLHKGENIKSLRKRQSWNFFSRFANIKDTKILITEVSQTVVQTT